MFGLLRNLPEQPLATRRRFVIVATSCTFTLIVLVWVGVTIRGWRGSTPAPPTPTAGGSVEVSPATTPESAASGPDQTLPNGSLPAPEPSPTPTFDLGQISTNLIKVFAPPEKTKKP